MGKKMLVWLLFMCGLVFLLQPGRILANMDQATPIPSQLSLSPIAKGFQIHWEPGSDDAVVYKIFWSNADTVSETDHVGVLTTSATTFEHTGLVPGRTYYYRIMACSCDCSPLSNVTSAVFQTTSADVHTLSGNVTVNGNAIRPSADPMVTATVRATEITGANLGNSANVNADGSYQMALFPGTYHISVDYWFAKTANGTSTNFGSWGHPGPQNLLVSADTSCSVDIALHVLTGVIKDTSGNPVPNVAVVYSHGSTTTSSEGTYTLYFLQGTYGLEIKPPASTRFVPATVEVSIPGTAPAIALQEQSLLSGSVTVNGSPIQSGADPAVSATVRATEVTGANQGNSATVNPDGTYQLALAPGTYNIAVNYWLGESWRGNWINFATWSHPGPQNLKFSADMTTNIDLPLHELTGIVKDADGNPLSNVDLSYSNGSTTTSQAPGFEGTYKLYFLQGTYALEVRPPAATRYVATSVEVSIPGTAPSIELQKQALLSGSITVNGSMLPPEMMASMAGATVRATETNGANQGNTVEVDSDGTYRMALSPGTYNISVDYWFGEDWHGTSINYGSWGYPGARNLSVTTDISQDIDIPLHVLSGTVKDISGNPVSDVQLNYSGPYSNGTIKTSAEAGFEGTYKLYFLPGTYSVQVNAPPALYPPFQVKRVTIIEDATRNIVLGNDYSVLEQAIAMIPPHLELHLDVFDILTDEPDKVYDLAISSHRDLAQIIINWADGDMQASVYRPNGTVYGQYQADKGPIVLDIQNPEIGTWTCAMTAMAISQDDHFPVAIVVALTPSQPPVADADGPYSSMAGTPVTLDASNSFDPDGAIVLYEWDLDNDGVFDQNTTHSSISHIWHKAYAGTVRLRVTDDEGHVDIACVSVQVSATTAPDITLTVSRDTLWPPNHKMVPITVDVSAADLDPEAVCHITAVSSNESEDGLGDGHTAPDWEIIADLTVNLRAERSGPASGRIYTITVECIDATGAMASAEAEVAVPHDQGKKNGKK